MIGLPSSPEGSPSAQPLRQEPLRARPRELVQKWRARQRRRRRGVALVMVLGTLTLLSVMLIEFQDSTSAELGSSVAARDQLKAEYAARSAVNLTRLLIAAEPTVRPVISMIAQAMGVKKIEQVPIWDFSDAILGAFGDEEGSAAFSQLAGLSLSDTRNLGLDGAGFRIEVVDEDSKINLNLAARADSFSQQRMAEQLLSLINGVQYNELFEEADERGDLHDRQVICGALIDWADPNTDFNPCNPRAEYAIQSGVEDSYYQMLPRPYRRKNAAFDSLEEVRLVRGINDIFWNTFVQPNPDKPESRVLTVWGSGAINVNSANPQTLLALACHKAIPNTPLCVDPILKHQFLQALRLASAFMPGIPAFSSPKEFVQALQGKGMIGMMFASMQIPPVQLLSESEVEKAISVKSMVFSIYATGYVRSGMRETRSHVHAVVDLRGAPPPGATQNLQQLNAMQAAGAEMPVNLTALPRPGGTILYYRVD